MDFNINVEYFHERCYENYIQTAMDFFGPKTTDAAIVCLADESCEINEIDEIEDIEYNCIGKFRIPEKSGYLISEMAKFSLSTISCPGKIEGLDLIDFPKHIFCLKSVLQSGVPKDTKKGIFKINNGGLLLLSTDADTDEEKKHIAFAGLGIIIMKAARQIISPMSTDDEIIDLSFEKYLIIPE